MTHYPHARSFYVAVPGLIEAGATAEDIYREMLTVEDLREVDGSPDEVRRLASSWAHQPNFLPIRLGELFGGLAVEHTDDYVLAFIAGLGASEAPEIRAFMLRNDHDLREELFWRIFEIEGGGEVSLANVDKYSNKVGSWQDTVLALTADGTLDRARVLHSCLEALNRDFSSYRAGWFSRVYSALAPTPAEAAADQDLLRLTLASPVTASTSLAVKSLAAVHKAGLLDADAFVEACRPVLTGAKGAAAATLRILSALAKDAVADPGAVAEVIALGAGNAHADVQRAAVTALVRLGREDIARRDRDLLAPGVAAELLPGAPAPAAVVPVQDLARPAAEPVRPWSDDDALERYALLLEDQSDAIELELALAWLATASTAGAVLAPLVKRARKRREVGSAYVPASELLLAAVSPDHAFMEQEYWRDEWGTSFADGRVSVMRGDTRPFPTAEERSSIPSFIRRLREVAAVVQGREPSRPLLATPTDSHGWVDRDVFVDRIRAAERSGLVPLPADLSQAVLRLAPGVREDVLVTFGLRAPVVTDSIRIEWQGTESDSRKPSGAPMWVWWRPAIFADEATARSVEHPALIPSVPRPVHLDTETSALETAAVALSSPPSTLPLVAVGISPLAAAMDEATPVGEEAVLDALSWHPGLWTPETVQLVALGMAAKRPEMRARAVELLVAAVPDRISAEDAAAGFAACAPACVLTRWSASMSDAASLAAGPVVDVLTALLPLLDRRARGVGSLLTVLLDESIRLGRASSDPALRAWLSGFTGASAAARCARALLGDALRSDAAR